MDVNEPIQLILMSFPICQSSNSRFTEDCSLGGVERLSVLPYSRFPMIKRCFDVIGSALYPINRWGSLTGIFCLIFGGIHCISWNFEFPSPQERLAWRICCVILTVSIPSSWLLTRLILRTWLEMSGHDVTDHRGTPPVHWMHRIGQRRTIMIPLVEIGQGLGLSPVRSC
jgi:hypothetical protein